VLNDSGAALKGTLFVAGVTDEEYGMLGAHEIGENGPKACIHSLRAGQG
jgi:acetylornithine deacetylase/succinyl-diaminopimelate desuccinylase-like protein